MSSTVWSKKTVAVIAIAAFVGVMSPISASAWDNSSGPDEIVTVTVDLGENPEDGGGGGNVCTGFGSLTIPLTNIPVTKERKILKTVWQGQLVDLDTDPLTPDVRDTSANPIDPYLENTRTNYVSSQFVVRFDADNCEASDRSGYVWTERQPVERYSTGIYQPGEYWLPVEMTRDDGILDASTLKATANLRVDYSLFGVNRNDVKLYDNIEWTSRPQDPNYYDSWGTRSPNMGMPLIWGTSGEANARASITIYGDTPVGKYRVKHGFTLDTSNYNDGPWFCYIGFCP